MLNKSKLIRITLLFFALVGWYCTTFAEGLHQAAPGNGDVVWLIIDEPDYGNFANEGSANSTFGLAVEVLSGECIYLGLSRGRDGQFGNVTELTHTYEFRIVGDSSLSVWYTLDNSTENITSYSQASGPSELGFSGGYNASETDGLKYCPPDSGTYWVEFRDAASNAFTIPYWDLTVGEPPVGANAGSAKPGRVHSQNWAFRTPEDGIDSDTICTGFNRVFNGMLFSYTSDGFVSTIDFANSGFRGLSFNVAFDSDGPGSGTDSEKRMSVPDQNLTQNAAEHKIFLQAPDAAIFPDGACGEVSVLGLGCDGAGYCILVEITEAGQVDVVLDFNDNQIYDLDTDDVVLVQCFDTAGVHCVAWNGILGDSTAVLPGTTFDAVVRFSQGVQHYAAYDVEYISNGFCIETVRPAGCETDNKLYWDDRDVAASSNTGQPKDGRNGGLCGNGTRTWAGWDCENGDDYGNSNTINTWWFAYTTVSEPVTLLIDTCIIAGPESVCTGAPFELTTTLSSESPHLVYEWTFNEDSLTNTETVLVAQAIAEDEGNYCVSVTDTVTKCTATCCYDLIILPPPPCNIATDALLICDDSMTTLTASGGTQFLWRGPEQDSATSAVITVGTAGTYTVEVTDAQGCIASCSVEVVVEICCEFIIACPATTDLGSFGCQQLGDIPAHALNAQQVQSAPYQVGIGIDPCGVVRVLSSDSAIPDVCSPEDQIIIRTVTIWDDLDSNNVLDEATEPMEICAFSYTILADTEPPTVSADLADVTFECGRESTAEIATWVAAKEMEILAAASDLCSSNLTITSSFDPIALDCNGNRQTPILFQVLDECGNPANLTIMASLIDTKAPVIQCPAPIQLTCADEVPPANVLAFTALDDCDPAPSITHVSDVVTGPGICFGQNYIIERTYQVVDKCGNVANCIQDIIVAVDYDPPTLTVGEDRFLQCGESIPTPEYEATDNCSQVTVEIEETRADYNSCEFLLLRVYTATDACGNTTMKEQRISFEDSEAPVIVLVNPLIADIPNGGTLKMEGCPGLQMLVEDAQFLDCCALDIRPYDKIIASNTCGTFDYHRKWECGYVVEDAAGNVSEYHFFVEQYDVEPPELIGIPADISVDCGAPIPGPPAVTATDDCSILTNISYSEQQVEGNSASSFVLLRTWTAEDQCGNASSETQTITVCGGTASGDTRKLVGEAGILNSDVVKIQIFPNPAADHINLLSEAPMRSVELRNSWGQRLQVIKPNETSAVLDLGEVPAGIYYLILRTAEGTFLESIIKL